MSAILLDACGLINLYASGRFESILAELKHDWYLPSAVKREAQHIKQDDPEDPSRLLSVAIELDRAFAAGILKPCDCETDAEVEGYIELLSLIRDDGESMGIAIAESRGWRIVTDDRKARRIAAERKVATLSTPELIKAWAEASRAETSMVAQVLENIQKYARVTPYRGLPGYAWWHAMIGR